MTNFRVPHGAFLLVCDGRRGFVLRNTGDNVQPSLKTLKVFAERPAPRTSEIGADAPGRAIEALSGRRSTMEQIDLHDGLERKFVAEVAADLNAQETHSEVDALVIVAPPRTLAELRRHLSDSLKLKIVTEINKDLTRHSIEKIERLLARKLRGGDFSGRPRTP